MSDTNKHLNQEISKLRSRISDLSDDLRATQVELELFKNRVDEVFTAVRTEMNANNRSLAR